MMIRKRIIIKRICALMTAVIMAVSGLLPGTAASVWATDVGGMSPGTDASVSADDVLATQEVVFTVKDSEDDEALTDVAITVDKDGEETEIVYDDKTKTYSAELAEGEYTYEAEKTGYEYADASASREFTVEPDMEPIEISLKLSEIIVSSELLDLKVGDSSTVTITNQVANQQYGWISRNEDVATVNNGEITAMKAGETEITVSYKSKSQNIAVSVTRTNIGDKVMVLKIDPLLGTNVKEVTWSIDGLPEDATGKVVLSADGVALTTIDEVSDGRTSTFTLPEDFVGKKTFTATYEGDIKYNSCTAIQSGWYKENLALVLTEAKKTVTYGDAGWNQKFSVTATPDSPKGRVLEFTSSNPDVATVEDTTPDDSGAEVTLHKSGNATITVKAMESDEYMGAEATYSIEVKKAEVTDVAEFTWDKELTKVYDGNANIALTGKLTADDNETLTIPADKATIASADVMVNESGEIQKQDVTIKASKYETENYILNLTEDGIVEKCAAINYRPLYLKGNDAKTQYGKNLETYIQSQDGLVSLAGTIGEKAGADEGKNGLVEGETVEAVSLPKATLADAAEDTKLSVGTHENKIIPDIKAGEEYSGNYLLRFDNEDTNKGTLQVEEQQLSDAELLSAILAEDNTSIYQIIMEGMLQKIWVRGTAGVSGTEAVTLKLSIKPDYEIGEGDTRVKLSDYYDTVYAVASDSPVDMTNVGIEYSNNTAASVEDKSIQIYLGKQAAPDTRTSGEKQLEITVDTQRPQADFKGLRSAGAVSELAKNITFGLFDKKEYVETVTVNDGVGVGVTQFSYYIWKVKNNTGSDVDAELTAEKVKEKAGSITSSGDWNSLHNGQDPADGELTFQIPVATGSDAAEVEGNYVVLLKAVDRVGNGAVYTSNGLVADMTVPSVSLRLTPEKNYYNGDVDYTISVSDLSNAYYSGISNLKVQVDADGKALAETTEPKDGVYLNTYNINLMENLGITEGDRKYYTNAELKQGAFGEIKGRILAADANSNDVRIRITATDQAGNECTMPIDKAVIIDTTEPEMSVTYDKNAPVNDVYFQDSRVMTVVYKERNFDIDNAKFNFKVNGEQFADMTVDSINALDPKYGIRADWLEATTDPGAETAFKDGRANTVKLTFSGNAQTGGCDYTDFTFAFKDKADNACTDSEVTFAEGSKAERNFSVDNLAPAATVIYTVDGEDVTKQIHAGEIFSNQEITASVSIKERNFWQAGTFSDEPKQMSVRAEGTEAPGGISDFNGQAQQQDEWNENTGTYTIVFRFNRDANYTFGFTYTDLAGRSVEYAANRFTYDNEPPTGKILFKENVWVSFFNNITFGIFDRNPVEVNLEGDDITAGVKSVMYYRHHPDTESRDEFSGLDLDQLAAMPEADWVDERTLTIAQNEQAVIYERVIDRADNVTYLNSDGVISDNTAPEEPSIAITMGEPAHRIYNSNVPFHISVTDPKAGNTYAGLESVYYEVRKDGEMTQSGDYNDALAPKTSRVQNIERDETVDASLNNSNDVVIYVKATDNAGNTAEAEKELSIDITDPSIQVSYDQNSPLNGRYYGSTRTATVVVTERNFDPSAVRFNITNTDGTEPSVSGWSSSENAGVSDSATNTCIVTFAADGDYTFTLNCTDLAGNDSDYTQVDDFTVDQTEPTIQVSYDNDSAQTSGYYKDSRTATVTINEHNFNAGDVNAAITASLQGQGVPAPGIGGWSEQGDIRTASVTFSSDADYTFDIDYSDMAGNAAADYTQNRFTVDKTKPQIDIFDIKDKSANNGTVAPGVKYSDVNYTEGGVNITLKGTKHKSKELDGARSSIPNGQSIKMADLRRTEENDDLYTLKAEVMDKAGNKTEKSVMFSVNRFGSVYVFSDSTQELLDNYYTNEEKDLVVTEINVDSLEFNGISYGRDGELVKLDKGRDYTVKASGSEGSWKQYQYTVKKENFEQEGNYTVTIDSKDRAANVVNNKVKDKEIKFVVDKTAPTVVISGIEDGQQYRADARDVSLNVTDNIAMGNVDVYLDDSASPVKSYNAAAVEESSGELLYTLDNAKDFQSVKAVARDAAGNVAESASYRVLVTSNLFVQYYSNKPLLAGSIIVLVLIAAGIAVPVIRKKKR